MLEDYYGSVESLLTPPGDFHPFPMPGDWNAVPEEFQARIIKAANAVKGFDWPVIPATYCMDFQRSGNRIRHFECYMQKRRVPLLNLVLAECLKNDGSYLDDIINGLWAILDEATWVLPAHYFYPDSFLPDVIHPDKVIVDLYSAETGSLLCWVYYLLKPQLDAESPRICERLVFEVRRRLLSPFLTLHFWWMDLGANNWNPWITSNIIACTAIISTSQEERSAVIEKAIRVLDNFTGGYHSDGGCDEGPAYWGAAGGSLYDSLELLSALTDGAIDIFSHPLIRNICTYICKMHISGKYYVNFADAHAIIDVYSNLIFRMGKRFGDSDLIALGLASRQEQIQRDEYFEREKSCIKIFRYLNKLFTDASMTEENRFPLLRDVYLDGIQVMAARRQAGSDNGLYLCAKGGHNGESHNHNDVGSFVIYCDGKPLLIDVGSGQYTAQTFSPRRYEIKQMQSSYHNLPEISGCMQCDGLEFHADNPAYRTDDRSADFSLDIHLAYPKESGLLNLRRCFRLDRIDGSVTILDEYALANPAEFILNFISAVKPIVNNGEILYKLEEGCIAELLFDSEGYTAEVDEVPTDDEILLESWGKYYYRLRLTTKGKTVTGISSVTVRKL